MFRITRPTDQTDAPNLPEEVKANRRLFPFALDHCVSTRVSLARRCRRHPSPCLHQISGLQPEIALSFLSHHLPLPSILRHCHPLPLYSMFFFVATSVTLLIPSESRCSFPDLYTPDPPFCFYKCGFFSFYLPPSFALLSDIHYCASGF